jgi:hypothetical protein
MRFPSLKMAYLIWVLLIVVPTIYGLITGEYQSLMSLAVDKAGSLPADFSHQQMLLGFIVISLGAAIALIIVAGILVLKASKNKKWAIWTLTILALWQSYDSIYSNFQLSQMYPGTIGIGNWLLSVICSTIWLYIIFAAHKLTEKSDAEVHNP